MSILFLKFDIKSTIFYYYYLCCFHTLSLSLYKKKEEENNISHHISKYSSPLKSIQYLTHAFVYFLYLVDNISKFMLYYY